MNMNAPQWGGHNTQFKRSDFESPDGSPQSSIHPPLAISQQYSPSESSNMQTPPTTVTPKYLLDCKMEEDEYVYLPTFSKSVWTPNEFITMATDANLTGRRSLPTSQTGHPIRLAWRILVSLASLSPRSNAQPSALPLLQVISNSCTPRIVTPDWLVLSPRPNRQRHKRSWSAKVHVMNNSQMNGSLHHMFYASRPSLALLAGWGIATKKRHYGWISSMLLLTSASG